MVTITRHIFNNIFQTENFSAAKFATSYEEKMSFIMIPKSPKVWREVEKSNWAPLTPSYMCVKCRPHLKFVKAFWNLNCHGHIWIQKEDTFKWVQICYLTITLYQGCEGVKKITPKEEGGGEIHAAGQHARAQTQDLQFGRWKLLAACHSHCFDN